MTWILLGLERLAAFETPKGIHVMLHQNTVFHSLTKYIPWDKFAQLVEKYGADKLSRTLKSKQHFIALLYGQFSGAASLRETVTGMTSHETRLYHLGGAAVKRSTMSDANSNRPCEMFAELFTQMLQQAHRGLRRAVPSLRITHSRARLAQTSSRSLRAKTCLSAKAGCDQTTPPR